MVSNGETVKTPFSRYAANTDDSTSSREKPQVVWVRSLVPKEKKSAASAIRCAVSAARGNSIIVPIGMVSVDAAFGAQRPRPGSARTRPAPGAAPSPNPTSGTMISTFGFLPASDQVAGRLGDRPDLQREQARRRAARAGRRAGPASGSIRAASPPRRAASGRRRRRRRSRRAASASATLTASSVRSGRNSCSGGSSSRMFTGSPSIASSSSVKSLRCNGNSASSAASRSSAVPARMTRSISDRRSPRNMCSVRHSPMPWAPSDLRPGRVLGGVRVGPDRQPAPDVGVGEQPVDRLAPARWSRRSRRRARPSSPDSM